MEKVGLDLCALHCAGCGGYVTEYFIHMKQELNVTMWPGMERVLNVGRWKECGARC
jgi:hypothetical protein